MEILEKALQGNHLTDLELVEVARATKALEDNVKKLKEILHAEIVDNCRGEDIKEVDIKKGAERRTIPDANLAFWKIRDELGKQFDGKLWSETVPKVTATDCEKFIVACGIDKNSAKESLATMLGDGLKTTYNKSSWRLN